ncbi:MAG: flippase-like domain-containing protein, partial [Muribaculaceae bacterium]|nr:flippase-like domain-containing protein [Muribaculaceae bacterium]
LTLFLDMMFFVVTVPIIFLLISPSEILNFSAGKTDTNLAWVLMGIYLLVIFFSIILAVGIFYKPKAVGAFFLKIANYKLLRRFRGKAAELADGLNRTSYEIKQYSWRWWIAPSLATIITWVARMLLVNAIFFAFIPEANQPVIFARQIIVTILLMFVPTPGGSGVGEMLFKTYYADMINGPVIAIMAIIWRLFTSYIFLLTGITVLPSFLKLYSSNQIKPNYREENNRDQLG